MIKKTLVSIIFLSLLAALFFGFYIVLSNPTPVSPTPSITESDWTSLSKSKEVLYRGKIQYQLRCYKCHGMQAEGNYRGPSLIDENWVYGDSFQSIYHTIYNGAGAMKGYGKKLTPDDIKAITVYIKSISNKD